MIVVEGPLFDVEAVLEAGAAARQHADPEAGASRPAPAPGYELLHFLSGPAGQGRGRTPAGACCWMLVIRNSFEVCTLTSLISRGVDDLLET